MTYEEITEGMEIPSLKERVTVVKTVMYCGITWDFARYHYDGTFVREHLGFRDPVVDPQMYGGFLARMLTEWISTNGRVRKLNMKYRTPAYLEDTLTCKGKVVKKHVEKNEKYVHCDLAVENQKGEQIVQGSAVLLMF